MSTNPAFLDFYGQHFLIYRKNRTGMLDKGILDQVKSLLGGLKSEIGIKAVCGAAHTKAEEFGDFLKDFCSCSDKLKLELTVEDNLRLEFTLYKDGADTGIVFRGIPAAMSSHRCCLQFSMPTDRERTCPTILLRAASGPSVVI